jgi:hypothetical protein
MRYLQKHDAPADHLGNSNVIAASDELFALASD